MGKIGEIMFDIETGKISCIVLSSGGFLGLRDRLIAVPWSSLVLDAGKGELTLSMDKEALGKMPIFERSKGTGTSGS